MKKLFILLFLLNCQTSFASCPLADLYRKAKDPMVEWKSHHECATVMNDAESQYYIGETYLNGNEHIPQSLTKALKYFRLGAENGYAPAQRELAKLMDALYDMGKQGANALDEIEQVWSQNENSAQVQLPALSWLMLAAEKEENKWFYFAPAIMDKEAEQLLPQMKAKYGSDAVQQATTAAGYWKQAQLMRQAKSLLTERAYKQFETIIYPSKIEPPKMSRAQAIEELKKLKMSIIK